MNWQPLDGRRRKLTAPVQPNLQATNTRAKGTRYPKISCHSQVNLISVTLLIFADRPDNLIEVTGEPLKTDFDILSSHEPSVLSSPKSSEETKKDPEVLLFEEAVRQYKSIDLEVLIRIAEDARGH